MLGRESDVMKMDEIKPKVFKKGTGMKIEDE
jgi:hypothetical protein